MSISIPTNKNSGGMIQHIFLTVRAKYSAKFVKCIKNKQNTSKSAALTIALITCCTSTRLDEIRSAIPRPDRVLEEMAKKHKKLLVAVGLPRHEQTELLDSFL